LSRSYRRFIAGYLAVVAAAGLGLLAVLRLSSGFIDVYSGGSAWAARLVRQKSAILAATRPPRMVIVSGSAGLFGLDAAQMSDTLQIPVVNLAVHASLVWRYLDFYAFSQVTRGDTVILPLETEYFGPRDVLNTFTVESSHALGLGFLLALPLRLELDYLRFLSPGFLARQLYRQHFRVKERVATGYWVLASGPHGDIDIASAPSNAENVRKNALRQAPPIDPASAGLICASIARLKLRGIRVIGTPPNVFVDETIVARYEALIGEITALVRRCGGEFITVARNGRQPIERMLDTRYHLNASGRRARTAELVDAFRAAGSPVRMEGARVGTSTEPAGEIGPGRSGDFAVRRAR
jgi:hypothetical protein